MFPNSPAFRWMIQALATRWDGSARPLPSAESDEFWEQVKRLAFKHRMVGILARQARQIPELMPYPVQLWLTASSEVEGLKSDALRPEVHRALAALEAAGVPFLVLQGWGLIARVYENDLSQRPTTDLDLFFPPQWRAESLRVLEGLGYYRYRTYPHPGFTARYERVEFLRRDDMALIADSHYAFAEMPLLWKRLGRGWFERCEQLNFGNMRMPVCAPADLLLYQAVHLFSHYRDARLYHYYDLALLARLPGLDWDVFTAQALASGMCAPLTAILRRVDSWWPGTLPAGTLSRLARRRDPLLVRPYYRRVLSNRPARGWAMLLKVLTLPGIKKITCLVEYAFPSRAYLVSRYHLPKNASWLKGWLRHVRSTRRRVDR